MVRKCNFKIIETNNLNRKTKSQLLELWNNEYPEKLYYKDLVEFDAYLENLFNLTHLLLVDEKNIINGWAFSFDKESERWFGIMISEKFHGQGLGSKMLDKLKQTNHELYGWVIDHNYDKKINGKPYNSPLTFYKKHNFEIVETERLELEKISAVKIRWKYQRNEL